MKTFAKVFQEKAAAAPVTGGDDDESRGCSGGEGPRSHRMRSPGTHPAAAAEDAGEPRREAVSGSGSRGLSLPPSGGRGSRGPPHQSALPSLGRASRRPLGSAVVGRLKLRRSLRTPSDPASSPLAPPRLPCLRPRPSPSGPPTSPAESRGAGLLPRPHHAHQVPPSAQPAMALSMPLNGLKEEDKEPLIELFVKVSERSPSRAARVPHAPEAPPRGVPAARGLQRLASRAPSFPLSRPASSRLAAGPRRSRRARRQRAEGRLRRAGRARLGRAAWVLSLSSRGPTPPRSLARGAPAGLGLPG
ncbi:hypothetical protein NN561_013228 [Cricetulus griseus]